MGSKAPPVPRDHRTARGGSSPATRDAEVSRDPAGAAAGSNLKQQGRYGGVNQNIVHQGRQQDR